MSKLAGRLSSAEDDAAKAAEDAKAASEDLTELEDRIAALEDSRRRRVRRQPEPLTAVRVVGRRNAGGAPSRTPLRADC